jgi:hypothetical protein
MKRTEVQDDPRSLLGPRSRLTWAVDDDGRYVGVKTNGWEAEIDANRVCTDADAERVAAAWEAARAGRTSPLAYHMTAAKMDVGLLAQETGIWAWRVRRHLRLEVFSALSDALVARYADALGLTPEAVRTLPAAPEP